MAVSHATKPHFRPNQDSAWPNVRIIGINDGKFVIESPDNSIVWSADGDVDTKRAKTISQLPFVFAQGVSSFHFVVACVTFLSSEAVSPITLCSCMYRASVLNWWCVDLTLYRGGFHRIFQKDFLKTRVESISPTSQDRKPKLSVLFGWSGNLFLPKSYPVSMVFSKEYACVPTNFTGWPRLPWAPLMKEKVCPLINMPWDWSFNDNMIVSSLPESMSSPYLICNHDPLYPGFNPHERKVDDANSSIGKMKFLGEGRGDDACTSWRRDQKRVFSPTIAI